MAGKKAADTIGEHVNRLEEAYREIRNAAYDDAFCAHPDVDGGELSACLDSLETVLSALYVARLRGCAE